MSSTQKKITAEVRNRDLSINSWNDVKRILSTFDGHVVSIVIDIFKPRTSDRQRGYYFGCVVEEEIKCFKEFWGRAFTKEQVHHWNHENFFCEEFLNEKEEVIKMPASTSDMKKKEFENKLEAIRGFFYDKFDWRIPLPNEYEA